MMCMQAPVEDRRKGQQNIKGGILQIQDQSPALKLLKLYRLRLKIRTCGVVIRALTGLGSPRIAMLTSLASLGVFFIVLR